MTDTANRRQVVAENATTAAYSSAVQEDLMNIIEAKGREIAEALAALRVK